MKYFYNIIIIFILFSAFITSCQNNYSKSNTSKNEETVEEEIWEDCKHCRGVGYYTNICSVCEGSGRLTSVSTETRRGTCPTCKGFGFVPCERCDNYGYLTCTRCSGHGSYRCHGCNGTGVSALAMIDGEIIKSNCGMCNGGGYETCLRCGGKGKVTCGVCYGEGRKRCATCNGSGGPNEIYSQTIDQGECPKCGGLGKIKTKCNYCNGEGRVRVE